MRLYVLIGSAALCSLQAPAWAIPPREGGQPRGMQLQQARPNPRAGFNSGSPSLSPPRQPATGPGGLSSGGRAGLPPGAGGQRGGQAGRGGGFGGGAVGGGPVGGAGNRPGGGVIGKGGAGGASPGNIGRGNINQGNIGQGNIGQGNISQGIRPGGPGLGGMDRPGSRPGGPSVVGGGGGFPGSGNRPNWPGGSTPGSRPGQRPDHTFHRPGGDNRPGSGNRPGWVNPDVLPPDINIGRPGNNFPIANRPSLSRPDININRPVTVNRPITNIDNTVVNQSNIVNSNFFNRYPSGVAATARRVPGYYSSLYNGWQPTTNWANYQPLYAGYYANSSGYASNWLGSGVAAYSYVNPFYGAQPAATVTSPVFDYSQPIRVPAASYQETSDDLVRSEQAMRRFDDARELFRRGEYGRANDAIDEAVQLLPSDPTLHQLRGLILFARRQYSAAAAAIYSVLAVSPGWSWETVGGLYDDPKHYEAQLGELQQYAAAHPDATDAQFLLAYHATVIGDLAAAEAELNLVRTARPDDRLTENLLAALRRPRQP